MNALALTDIERMSTRERLQAIEMLWESLTKDGERDLPSPEWHTTVLAARRAKVERGEAKFLTLEELKTRLRSDPA